MLASTFLVPIRMPLRLVLIKRSGDVLSTWRSAKFLLSTANIANVTNFPFPPPLSLELTIIRAQTTGYLLGFPALLCVGLNSGQYQGPRM